MYIMRVSSPETGLIVSVLYELLMTAGWSQRLRIIGMYVVRTKTYETPFFVTQIGNQHKLQTNYYDLHILLGYIFKLHSELIWIGFLGIE